VVAKCDKQRFRISEDGARIRANQGHTVKVAHDFQPAAPPDVLYHGTARASLPSIMASGLDKRRRHHVHLSATEETALKVGKRHGAPVVLKVDARAMADAGVVFFVSENGVWLTDAVPQRYLTVSGEAER